MIDPQIAQILLAAATLVTALAGLVVAARGHAVASETKTLVNGQAEQLNTLREAKGRAEGVIAGAAAARLGAAPAAEVRSE
jgi:hypothetical protein